MDENTYVEVAYTPRHSCYMVNSQKILDDNEMDDESRKKFIRDSFEEWMGKSSGTGLFIVGNIDDVRERFH